MGFASPHLLLVTDPNQSPGEKFWNKSSGIKHPRVDQGPGSCLDPSSPGKEQENGARQLGPVHQGPSAGCVPSQHKEI